MIVTDQYEPMVGGVPTATRELAEALPGGGTPSRSSHRAPRGTAARRRPADRMAGGLAVDYRGSVPWPWYEGQRLGFLPPARPGELIAAFGPDVVHLHSPLTLGVTARTAARRRGVPVLYTNHYLPLNVWPAAAAPGSRDRGPRQGRGLLRVRHRVRQRLQPRHRADHDRAAAAARPRAAGTVAGRVERRRPGRFAPGRPDEALRSAYPLPPGRPVILSVGRLSPEKRADVLIAAVARLADRSPGTTAATAARSSCSPGRATTSAGCGPSPATTGSRTGCGSPASSPTATCPACTGSPTCSPSRRRQSCSHW